MVNSRIHRVLKSCLNRKMITQSKKRQIYHKIYFEYPYRQWHYSPRLVLWDSRIKQFCEYCFLTKKQKLFDDQNKPRVNNKWSFIDNPYLILTTCFVYTLSSHFCNNFFVRRKFYQTLIKFPGPFNLQMLY